MLPGKGKDCCQTCGVVCMDFSTCRDCLRKKPTTKFSGYASYEEYRAVINAEMEKLVRQGIPLPGWYSA